MLTHDNYDGVGNRIISPDYEMIKNSFKCVIQDLGIKPGTYSGVPGRKLLKEIQQKFYRIIESKLYKYSKLEIHRELFKCYSYKLYIKHKIKYQIQENVFFNWEQLQQKAYIDVMVIELLMLINLYSDHNEKSDLKIDNDALSELVGIAYELNAIQLNSDSMLESDRDFLFVVDDNFIYSFIESDEYKKWVQRISERKREYKDFSAYTRCTTLEDELEFNKAFFRDTGVDYTTLLSVLDELQSNSFLSQFLCITPNIFCATKDFLINRLKLVVKTDSVTKVVEFLSLNQSKIKLADNKMYDIIPTWNRKGRTERIDVKPIIEVNNSIFLSTPVFNTSFVEWKSAFVQLYLPFKYSLSNTQIVVDFLIKKVQKSLVEETELIFRQLDGFRVDKNVFLHKRNKKMGFPENLGDYDIIAVNESLKIIFIIECKNLEMTKTVHEVYSKDKHFFEDQKNCEKFNKRINYCKNNYHLILKAVFNIEDNSEYTIIPIMLFNRVIEPIKPISGFKILSFHEFYSNPLNFI